MRGDSAQVRECPRNRLVPGRAAESGRVVSNPPSAAGEARPEGRTSLCRTRRRGGARHRHFRSARAATEKSGDRGTAGHSAGRSLSANDAPPGGSIYDGFMTIEDRVPQLPESVADATIVSWHKKPGDAVARDENLVDLETDKVVLEVPAPAAGVLQEIKLNDGTTVTSGQLLAVIEAGATAGPGASAPAIMAASG